MTFLHTFVMSFFDEACNGTENGTEPGKRNRKHSSTGCNWNTSKDLNRVVPLWSKAIDIFCFEDLTCLHSLRHSAEMASSQQPSPAQPSDFLETPAHKSNHTPSIIHCVNVFYGEKLVKFDSLIGFIESRIDI